MLPHSEFCAGPTTLRTFSYFVVPGARPGMLVTMKWQTGLQNFQTLGTVLIAILVVFSGSLCRGVRRGNDLGDCSEMGLRRWWMRFYA